VEKRPCLEEEAHGGLKHKEGGCLKRPEGQCLKHPEVQCLKLAISQLFCRLVLLLITYSLEHQIVITVKDNEAHRPAAPARLFGRKHTGGKIMMILPSRETQEKRSHLLGCKQPMKKVNSPVEEDSTHGPMEAPHGPVDRERLSSKEEVNSPVEEESTHGPMKEASR